MTEEKKKKLLMCVVPGEIYVDEWMKTWEPVTFIDEDGSCSMCEKKFDKTPGYLCKDGSDEMVCRDCIRDLIPCEVFPDFRKADELTTLLDRFMPALLQCNAEFERHIPEKADGWLQCEIPELYTLVQKVAAKLLLAETKEDQLSETIDLIVSAIMLAERFIMDNGKDEDDIPY